jgi:hypothetical protein
MDEGRFLKKRVALDTTGIKKEERKTQVMSTIEDRDSEGGHWEDDLLWKVKKTNTCYMKG